MVLLLVVLAKAGKDDYDDDGEDDDDGDGDDIDVDDGLVGRRVAWLVC